MRIFWTNNALLAQPVEQLPCKQKVVCSNHTRGTNKAVRACAGEGRAPIKLVAQLGKLIRPRRVSVWRMPWEDT